MNTEKAKEWLSAYIEGLEFENNPELKEALYLVDTDPELRDWWDRQKKMDSGMADALHEIPVPEDLEARLLATVRVPDAKRQSRLKPYLWAAGIAAAVVIGVGTLFQLNKYEAVIQDIQESISGSSPDSFDHFRDGMAYYIRSVYFQLDHVTEDLSSIERWLQESDAPVYEDLPDGLMALRPIGCKEFEWQGQQVSLVCFHTVDGKIVHLFVLKREGVDPGQYLDIQRVARSQDLETGGWTTENNIYVLVGSDPEVDVEFALG